VIRSHQVILDAYIRVSQVAGRSGVRFISPAVQREQIVTWAASNGVRLAEVFEELDESGARADRPQLLEAIERVESKATDGLVVAKLDRFGRSLIDGLAAIARIEKAGGTFVSVADGLDLSTPTGKLVLRIMFSMGEWELDRVRANWQVARARAIERGVHLSWIAPVGYRRRKDGHLIRDPRTAPAIEEAFRRRAGGATTTEIAAYLNEEGALDHLERTFTDSGLWRLFANRTYLGEVRSGDLVNPDAHEQLVSEVTWQQAQAPKRAPWRRYEVLLAGICRCANCGRTMSPERAWSTRSPSDAYRCSAGKHGRLTCRRPAVARADELEPLVEEAVFKAAVTSGKGAGANRVRQAEREIEDARADLTSYRDSPRLLRRLGAELFEAGVAKRLERLESALLAAGKAQREHQAPRTPGAKLAVSWPELSVGERREAVAELIDCVVIEPGETPILERAWLFKRGRGPSKLGRGEEPRAIDGQREEGVRLRVPPRWPEGRIAAELDRFLGGRRDMPHYPAFERAGYARLHAQMMRWGGPYWWAHRLNLETPARMVFWTEARIEGALAPFLRWRKTWPRNHEFEAAGLSALRIAVSVHGGNEHWARKYGLPYQLRQSKWNPKRVERELEAFLAGRERFPTKSEFVEARRGRLYEAIRRHGGLAYWSAQFGLERPLRGRWRSLAQSSPPAHDSRR
jgi:DNA invertase Pin-like site-specific DNA recombinase